MEKKRVITANGFILADVVLGMFILVVAVLAIGGVYLQSSKSNIFADNRTVAYNWAQERVEYLKSTSSWRGDSSLKIDPTEPTDTGNASPPRTGFSRTTTLVCPAAIASLPSTTARSSDNLLTAVNKRLIDVTVTVSWTENGNSRSVTLETLIDRN
jgi:Tfp pilus assembly protein PilV